MRRPSTSDQTTSPRTGTDDLKFISRFTTAVTEQPFLMDLLSLQRQRRRNAHYDAPQAA
jgi:hypothetical protein